ncbi:MAG TPA: endonuclease III [Spirochaetia bacterium]|nr:endonuclease III [Spirochaetia bacterium]
MNSLQRENVDQIRTRASNIHSILKKTYPEAKPLLHYRSAWELLVGTILAAQCTDERVNQVTPALFAAYPGPRELADASQTRLEELIRSTGFFRNKAKNLKGLAGALMSGYSGKLPESMEELVALPGIGRKTANVILGHCFGKPAIVVDTHFLRLSHRLGFSTAAAPEKVERDLKAIVPETIRTSFSDLINWHGRFRCTARKPDCPQCEIAALCPYPEKTGT